MCTPLAEGSSSTPRSPGQVPKTIAIFGASWCHPGDALYAESERLGAALAAAGYRLVNGGYAGTMEGSAKGAMEAGGEVEGVLVPTLFRARSATGNAYLTKATETPTLLTRIEYILDKADCYVVMPGTLGTLTEACAAWNVAALSELGGYKRIPIFLYQDPWKRVMDGIVEALALPKAVVECLDYVKDAAEVVERLKNGAKEAKGGEDEGGEGEGVAPSAAGAAAVASRSDRVWR
jgi:uncharacterized protein (TIGR00730 family)